MKNPENIELFTADDIESWRIEWQNMPEYSVEDLAPQFQIIVNFSCAADVEKFSKLLSRNFKTNGNRQLPSVWYPDQEIGRMTNKRYIDES